MIHQLAAQMTNAMMTNIIPRMVDPTTTTIPSGVGDSVSTKAQNDIQNSALWTSAVRPLSIGIGIIVVIWGVWRTIAKAMTAKAAEAFKSLAITILVAGIMFSPGILFGLISGVGRVLELLVNTLTGLVGG